MGSEMCIRDRTAAAPRPLKKMLLPRGCLRGNCSKNVQNLPKKVDKTCRQMVYWSFIVGEGTQEPLLPAKKKMKKAGKKT